MNTAIRLSPRRSQGYERSLESAQAILKFVESRFEINFLLKQAILDLCMAGRSMQQRISAREARLNVAHLLRFENSLNYRDG
jgi:hypothetical protein